MAVTDRKAASNRLLTALARADRAALNADLEAVELKYGSVLYEPADRIDYVYFPVNSVVSLLTIVDQHQALEVGLVGNEGMVGVPLSLGIAVSPVRALVQGSGEALRMKAVRFVRHLQISAGLQRELKRYTYALMSQITQTAACNRFHVVEERLARWLLMTHDRMQVREFELTQEFLSHMLGVRRVGVTKAARALQSRNLIHYSRGHITIVDRRGLEAASCSCYALVREVHDEAPKAGRS